MESLGVALTALSRPADLLGELQKTVEALEGDEAHRDFDIWKGLHRRLHWLMVGGAGNAYGAEVQRMAKRSEGYQSAHKGQHMPRVVVAWRRWAPRAARRNFCGERC